MGPDQFVQVIEDSERKSVTLKLNRADKKNAINLSMYTQLSCALEAADKNQQIRSIVITGTSECFTSGNDLADFANAQNLNDENNPVYRFMCTLLAIQKPVIASVSGDAIGIGTTLLLHCDFIYCDKTARLSLPFVKLGLCPEYASSLILPKLVGMPRACEWLILGEPFSAQDAHTAGLITQIVDDVQAHTQGICEQLAALPPSAVKQTKRLLRKADAKLSLDVINDEIEHFSKALKGEEFAEAVGAFFEKRTPDFSSFE